MNKIGEIAVENQWMTQEDRDIILNIQKQRRRNGATEAATKFGHIAVECKALTPSRLEFLEYQIFGFGNFIVEKKIGEGGMGIVYAAQRENHKVALKICKDSPNTRFFQEIQVLQSFSHPNIVTVVEYGSKPRPFIAMEYIEGETLSEFLHHKKPSAYDITQLFKKIADTLEFIHSEEIIHRDIKPSNIMVDASGNIKMLDFGLAKIKTNALTKTGEFLGTPVYTSPEQLEGQKITYFSDIYSFGVTFFEALTQTKIFDYDSEMNQQAMLKKIQHGFSRPSQINPNISPSLEAIVYKCLHYLPQDRYISAKALSNDLQNFLDHKKVKAPLYWRIRLQKHLQRYKIAALTGLSVFVLSLFASFFVIYNFWRDSRLLLSEILLAKANQAYHNKNWSECAVYAIRGKNFIQHFSTKKAISYKENFGKLLLTSLKNYRLINKWQASSKHLRTIDFVDENNIVCGDHAGFITLWRIPDGKQLIKVKAHSERINKVKVNHKQNILATTGDNDNTIKIWNVTDLKLLRTVQVHTNRVKSLHFNKHNILLSTSLDGNVILYDVYKNTIVQKIKITNEKEKNVAAIFDQSEKYVLLATTNKIYIYDAKTLKLIVEKNLGHLNGIRQIVLGRDNTTLATSDGSGKIKIWKITWNDYIDITMSGELFGHKNRVQTLAFNNNNTILASGSADTTVRIWDMATFQNIEVLQGHSNLVHNICFSENNSLLVSCSADETICLWNMSSYTESSIVQQYPIALKHIEIDSHQNIVCTSGPQIDIFSLKNKQSTTIYKDKLKLNALAISPNIIATAFNEDIQLIYPQTKQKKTLKSHSKDITSLTLNKSGTLLFSGSADSTIKVWDTNNAKLIHTYYGHTRSINKISLHPNESRIVCASSDKTVSMWDVNKHQNIGFLERHGSYVFSVRYLDTNTFFSTSADANIIEWDANTLQPKKIYKGHTKSVLDIAFHPNKKYFASCSKDKTIVIWDKQEQQKLAILIGHSDEVRAITFNKDGSQLYSVGRDCSLRSWNINAILQQTSISIWAQNKLQIKPQQKTPTEILYTNHLNSISQEAIEDFFNLEIEDDLSVKIKEY